ncbi:MAG: thioredoxin-dependent thiol peroxidase [Alphaproteobacteria bacterium]|nr:thioredoxin-dependent thiol peroxidase [Alphaproteobacteria bacterium]
MVAEGKKAPNFKLPDADGEVVELAKCKGAPVVLYFYPKDDTSGCTKEALDFTAQMAEFEAAGTIVLGVSPDTQQKHRKFIDKHELSVRLLADTEKQAAQTYEVWVEKSMYGRKYMGVERATFLIDRSGKIVRIWRKVKVPGHVGEVLSAVQELSAQQSG